MTSLQDLSGTRGEFAEARERRHHRQTLNADVDLPPLSRRALDLFTDKDTLQSMAPILSPL